MHAPIPDPPAPLSPPEVKQALAHARTILSRGWCQHQSVDREGNHCLARALQHAHENLRPNFLHLTSYEPDPYRQLSLLVLADPLVKGRIAAQPNSRLSNATALYLVSLYNDHPSTTKEEVLSLLGRLSP